MGTIEKAAYDPEKLTYEQIMEIALILKECPKNKLPLICQLFRKPMTGSRVFQNKTITEFIQAFIQNTECQMIMKEYLYEQYQRYCRKNKRVAVTARSFSRYVTDNYDVEIIQRRMGFTRARFYKFNQIGSEANE